MEEEKKDERTTKDKRPVMVQIKVPEDIHARLKMKAAENRKPLKVLVLEILSDSVMEKGAK